MDRIPGTLSLLLVAALAAGCEQKTPDPAVVPAPGTGPVAPAPAAGTKPVLQPKRAMPSFPPLTEETARKVLHEQLDRLAGDDASRQALLYLAELGDRAGVNAVHEKLLAAHEGTFDDLPAAAVGAEAMIAYGDKDGAATALKVAQEYVSTDEMPDEYLVRALARVEGAERAEAVAALLKIAAAAGEPDGDEDVSTVAVQALARSGAAEAREVFVQLAGNAELNGRIRGAAVAGLLRLSDAKGKELAEKLAHESSSETDGSGAQPEDVIDGLGVEGAPGAIPYIRSIVDTVLADEGAPGMWEVPAAASAIARMHAKGGGAELVPWLREVGAKEDGFYESEAALALWALGEDASAAAVAAQLEGMVAAWSATTNMESAVEILDIAARRGVAAKPPFRAIVDSAAQLDPTRGQDKGTDYNLVSLKLAAAHAFLKSGGK
jgi:hypothetical protein